MYFISENFTVSNTFKCLIDPVYLSSSNLGSNFVSVDFKKRKLNKTNANCFWVDHSVKTNVSNKTKWLMSLLV